MQQFLAAGRDITARPRLQNEVDLCYFRSCKLSRPYECVSSAHGRPIVSRESPLLDRTGGRVLRVFKVCKYQTEIAIQRIYRLRASQCDAWIMRVRAHL